MTQDELLQALWPDTFVQPEVLSRHVLDIRKALGDHPKNPLFVETLPDAVTGSSPLSMRAALANALLGR